MKQLDPTIYEEEKLPRPLRLRPRETTAVTLAIPVEVWQSLQQIAASKDMSVEALLKLYIGHGLRQDLAEVEHLSF